MEIAGTGFFVDQHGRFVTAGHVLSNWQEISKTRHACGPAIYVPDKGWGDKFQNQIPFQYFNFIKCDIDSDADLVLCEPIENPLASHRITAAHIQPVTFATAEVPEGTAIAFTGFPLEFTFPVTSKGYVAGKMALEKSETGFDYILDKASWPGASGSPVYLANGRVIGLIQKGGVNVGSGLAYAKCSSVITKFLANHPYVTPTKGK